MTNRRCKLVAGIWAACVAFVIVVPVYAKTALPTQYIAPVATPEWEHAILKTAYGQDQGFAFLRSGSDEAGYNYSLTLGGHQFFAYDRTILRDNAGHAPADSVVRSVTAVLANGKAAPARRYLYNFVNATGERFNPAYTDVSNATFVENLAINYEFDSTLRKSTNGDDLTPYVQCVHTDWVYTVTFDANGGSGTMATQTYTNSATLAANAFARSGYTFDGWATSAGGTKAYDDKATVSKDLNLYARWKAGDVWVTFNGNGGSDPEAKSYKVGESYDSLPGSQRDGYQFMGWWTALDGGSEVTRTTKVTNPENHVLFAHWKAIEYEILYKELKEGATHTNQSTYTIEDEIEFAPPTPVDGFAFTGWNPSSIAKGSTGSKTVIATYLAKVDKPTVGNLTYNGKSQTCASSAKGYSVSGDVQESYPGTYTVTFKLNSGYCWSDGTQGDYSVDWQILKAQITDVTVEQKDPLVYTGKPQTALLTRTATLQGGQTASWGYSTLQDGSFSETVPEFTDVGEHTVYYRVEAQYHDPASGSFKVVIGAALSLKGNGGAIGGLSETNFPCTLGAPYPELPEASREGFAFAGWWTDRDFTNGVQKTTNDLVTVEALTLYARWKIPSDATTCTVTLDPGGKGTVEEPTLTRMVGAALGDLPVPTANDPAAHLFFGWYDASGNAVTRDTVVESDLPLVAKWSEKKFNEKLGTDLLCFTTTTEHPWVVDETGVHSGTIVYDGGGDYSERQSDLRIEVPERGCLSFSVRWVMQDSIFFSYFGWTTDDVVGADDRKSGEGHGNWSVDADGHLILRHGASLGQNTDRAWLDSLTWTPDSGKTVIDGWDSAKDLVRAPTNAIFETGGAAKWTVTDTAGEFSEGENGIASVTNLPHGRSTWTRMTVNGPGVITFKWKVSSEKGYVEANGQYAKCDYLEFCDGDASVAFIDGEAGFATFTYTNATAGTHAFTWRYVKDGTGTAGADRGFVDAVTWTPDTPEHPVPEAKDAVTISSAAVADGKFSLSFESDEQFDYNLLTNANLLINSWGVMETKPGTGTAITFGPLVIDGLPQLFYKIETIQRKD